MTTISINTGIEGISYQSYGVVRKSDYPSSKVYLPLSASIPSHMDGVFDLQTSDRLLSKELAPKAIDKDVTVPCNYSRLFEELENIGARCKPEHGDDQQAVQSALVLFSALKVNFESLKLGREALIRG